MYAILLGVALLLLYWGWIGLFFARVRPSLMDAIGRRLGVRVAESASPLDAGTYDVEGDHKPLRKSVAVFLADGLVMLAGTVGVAALVFIPAFVAGDRGWLLPLEAKLTGRGASLRIIGFGGMPTTTGKARFTLVAENVGQAMLANCLVNVDGYTARNGYLRGTSTPFELLPGGPRTIELDLDAARPRVGEHRFRLELECSAERLAVAEGVLQVR